MASLHPTEGARLVLERLAIEDGGARYRAHVYEPSGVYTVGEALLGTDLTLAWTEGTPAAWIDAFMQRWLRTLAKKHAADAAWPRKLTRWRSPLE